MSSYSSRALSAEHYVKELYASASRHIGHLGSRSLLLEAALRVIMRHDLLAEFTVECSASPPEEPKIGVPQEGIAERSEGR